MVHPGLQHALQQLQVVSCPAQGMCRQQAASTSNQGELQLRHEPLAFSIALIGPDLAARCTEG